MPYALTNEVLDRRRNCVTLADVVRHLQTAQEYWPMPLTSGIQAPKGKQLQSLMQQVELFNQERAAQKANKSSLSSRQSSGNRPQEISSFIAPPGPAPTSPKKEKKKSSKKEKKAAAMKTETRIVKKKVKKKKFRAPSNTEVSYFHAIKKKAAETMIEADDGTDSPGKFLIRAKDDTESLKFVISVVYKGSVTHHKLERGDVDENFLVNGKLDTKSTELNGSVDFLRKKHKGWPMELGEGIPAPGSGGGGDDGGASSESEYEEVEVEVEVEVAAGPEGGADAAVTAEGDEEDEAAPPRDLLEYKLTIITGKAAGSDTSGTVHVQLSGSLGEGANHKVVGRKRRDPLFQVGQEFTFKVKSPDVGDVCGVLLTHNGKSSNHNQTPDWFVDSVTVERAGVSQEQWHVKDTFSCNAWLNKAEGLSRSFEVDPPEPTTSFALKNPSVEVQRNRRNSKEYSDRHAVNANARGANIGNQHKFDNNAREMRRQKDAGNNTFDVRKVHGIARGSGGVKSSFDNNSAEMSRMMNAPKTNEQIVNPQQLVPVIMSRDKKADAVHSQGTRQAIGADAEIEAGKVSVSSLRAHLPDTADQARVRPRSTHRM